MKKTKKYLVLLLALVLALSLSACKADTNDKSEDSGSDPSKDTPVESPEGEEEEEKAGDQPRDIVDQFFKEFREYAIESVESQEAKTGLEETLINVFKQYDYRIEDEEINKKDARLRVAAIVHDQDEINNQYLFRYIQEVDTQDLSEEEKKEKGNAIHKELLENPPFMEVVNDFNFKKEDGNWVLVNADELNENILNAMIVE